MARSAFAVPILEEAFGETGFVPGAWPCAGAGSDLDCASGEARVGSGSGAGDADRGGGKRQRDDQC